MSEDKKRWVLWTARAVAQKIVAELEPVCERIEIAGSIRRQKPMVGDIEIIYVAKTTLTKGTQDLFMPTAVENLVDKKLEEWRTKGRIEPRLKKDGSQTWGDQIKLATAKLSGIPIDFFQTSQEAWWNYLVCRTGSAAHNMKIACAAQRQGRKWHPFGTGFEELKDGRPSGVIHAMHSEREVFEFVGLPWLEPRDRT
jgi:DNA polymerase/3'-5' exonuclease PolX